MNLKSIVPIIIILSLFLVLWLGFSFFFKSSHFEFPPNDRWAIFTFIPLFAFALYISVVSPELVGSKWFARISFTILLIISIILFIVG
ncbi:MAG: hypothetical protein COS24_00280 [Candidatus Nealsonbacteria bacterium CG02_land_8_20_14_3_00_34_20]|uniref:Uncharacterized protein n=2 Tax=Candidatus Nealsoniibacteriota TaxID=1817911 RepID=A0A2M7DBH8_9BACT|nr:MAG: hypothetical protein COV62_02560 [Candidatus Nealsonbacteria bacterium CG11_big_fil_rev_8_21_14_0_20_35_11]PIV45825.1 MAG: hypothetical protein COS24_00280 [Candidatus Nealsonbacteria bacterium CG02_land_8_20_14_3_00_34_20]